MDLRRLRCVTDVCPLNASHHASLTASRWIVPVAAHNRPVAPFSNGHTVALVHNRLLTWHRSFTRNRTPPPPFDPPSYIYVHEWVSDLFPCNHPGWRAFGISQKQAVTFLNPAIDYHKNWSDHARRHLKVFKKSNAVLRFGTLDELKKYGAQSYLSGEIFRHMFEQAESTFAIYPKDLEILVAADAQTDEPLGFFVSANCDEVRQSYYVGGFYTPAGERTQAMTGLIDWWFERSIARNYASVNFGDMAGSRTPSFDPSIGYSIFKTHFGIVRVWRPRTLWKIRFKFFNLDAVQKFLSPE